MYSDLKAYLADYSGVKLRYETLSRSLSWLGPPNPEGAFKLYQNAIHPALGLLVMGRTNVDRKTKLVGHAIDVIELSNFGATNDGSSPDDRTRGGSGALNQPSPNRGTMGSVLHYPQGWHFLMNDSWLLGGVHGHVEFHLASPRVEQNLFADGNLTVTGRELTGLRAFGYGIKKMFNGTEIAHCVDGRAADAATLGRYWQELDRGGWGGMIEPAAP